MPPKKDTRTNEEKINDLLKEYKEINKKQFGQIEPKDTVKYAVDGQLRYGGVVLKADKQYILLKNFAKKVSWSVDLTQPNLRVFLKKKK